VSELVIRTSCGSVRGERREGSCLFSGIPYAETPRFEPPRPLRWEGVLDATGQETDCWQYAAFRDESKDENPFYYNEFRKGLTFQYEESPMRLTITTPEQAENCPVLVFIHGGGHETGTIGEPPYGRSREYAKRGVILVSVGYRLNVLHLYRSRNYGLMDQLAAIRWVHENIRAFGGDPDKITIMGQSAGAMSVMDLCYSNALKGIVKGAICMSGGGLVPAIAKPWTEEQSKAFWDNVERRAGVSSEEEAKKLPIETLWNAWYAESRENWSFAAVQPGIDGTIIPELPQKRRAQGKILNIPMMLGVTSQDFMPAIIFEMAYSHAMWSAARKNRAPVYGYLFDRTPPGELYKAYHAADLWYMFGEMDKCWRPWEQTDYELRDQMIDYAANFARCGDPNGEGLPRWPAFTLTQRRFRLFDGESEGCVGPGFCRARMRRTLLREKGPM